MTDHVEFKIFNACQYMFKRLLKGGRALCVIDELIKVGMVEQDGSWITQQLLNLDPLIVDPSGVLLCWLRQYMVEQPYSAKRADCLIFVFIASLRMAVTENATREVFAKVLFSLG